MCLAVPLLQAFRQLLVDISATMPFIKLIPERIEEIQVGIARSTIVLTSIFKPSGQMFRCKQTVAIFNQTQKSAEHRKTCIKTR